MATLPKPRGPLSESLLAALVSGRTDVPYGEPGSPGAWGANGHVTFRSRASVPMSHVVVDGGTLIWLAPP